MVLFSIGFTLGVWVLQQQAVLPHLLWSALLTIPPAINIFFRFKFTQRIANHIIFFAFASVCGFYYAAWIAQERLSNEFPSSWQGRNISLVGVVANMPRLHERGSGFVFDVERVITPGAQVPKHILLSTFRNSDTPNLIFHAGERWQLTVRLKNPHGTSNPYNFDFEAWALERDLHAVGYVLGKAKNILMDENVSSFQYKVEQLREKIRTHFQQVLGDSPYVGVLNALAIGDQGSIPSTQWQIFTRTGVNHLMSISGLHITMLSGVVFAIFYWLWRRSSYLTLKFPARKAAALAGLLTALLYAMLTGYGVPAQRTVYMLGTVAGAMILSRNIAPSQLLSLALIVVVLTNPWSVISPGFWLSFGAVGLIFYITTNRLGQRHYLIEYSRIQWAMSIGLIPLLLAMFQQISIVSPIANAFSIPLVSFIVVPLTLLSAIFQIDWILQLAHWTMSWIMVILEWLNSFPVSVWTQHAPPVWTMFAGVFGVFWLMLPRGFPARFLGAIWLLPLFLILPSKPHPGNLRLTIFDVGQGLAVSAQTTNHTLLYDTGPIFNSESDSGNRILVPALRGMGIDHLDRLILTHDDADHTGGAMSVMQSIPTFHVLSSLPEDSSLLRQVALKQRCKEGQNWNWDGVQFEILHPEEISYTNNDIKNNNRGCVLRISIENNNVLLTADIEKNSEERLVKLHSDKIKTTLLVVPHHGSKTSSTINFVERSHPRYAVFSAGYRNHFGHPKQEILRRYLNLGSELLRTDIDGAILVDMNDNNIRIEKYRQSHARYWQTQLSQQSQHGLLIE